MELSYFLSTKSRENVYQMIPLRRNSKSYKIDTEYIK